MLKNTPEGYGSLAKILHWLAAVIIIGQFILGLWMVDLDYYNSWYTTAPHYHKSIGLLFAGLMLFRLFWRYYAQAPAPLAEHSLLQVRAAQTTHWLIYLIIFSVLISGYLISTAEGRAIDVFNWFSVPSLGEFIDQQEDIAGDFHKWLAYALIGLAAGHALIALKHHFIDKDKTLKRIL